MISPAAAPCIKTPSMHAWPLSALKFSWEASRTGSLPVSLPEEEGFRISVILARQLLIMKLFSSTSDVTVLLRSARHRCAGNVRLFSYSRGTANSQDVPPVRSTSTADDCVFQAQKQARRAPCAHALAWRQPRDCSTYSCNDLIQALSTCQ